MTQQNEMLKSAIIDGLVQDFNLTTFKELRRTVKIEIGEKLFVIQLWYDHRNANCPYDAKVFRVDPDTQTPVPHLGFPWVLDRDEETTLRTALSFLEERVNPN